MPNNNSNPSSSPTKHPNQSLKCLQHPSNRPNHPLQPSEPAIKSPLHAVRLSERVLLSPRYGGKDGLVSVENRVKGVVSKGNICSSSEVGTTRRNGNSSNKENVKLPYISKNNSKASLDDGQRTRRRHRPIKCHPKESSNPKLATQPSAYQFLTLTQQIQHAPNIKVSLLRILDSDMRKSVTIQSQITKLSQLTKKGSNLRKHLRSIQEDMLTISLKKKLRKISREKGGVSMVL